MSSMAEYGTTRCDECMERVNIPSDHAPFCSMHDELDLQQ